MSPAARRPRRALAAAKMYLNAAQVLEITATTLGTLSPPPDEEDPTLGPRVTPLELRAFLARLRLLDGVPFSYLVADSELLPTESIRFFYLDRAWTDALVQGALSVGTVSTADRAQLEALYATVRDEVDEEERLVRLPGGEAVQQGPAGPVSGFLLRSRAVSGWPGLHVRAYREELGQADDATIPESDPRRIKVLRMERLAPAVLLVLFDGVPAVVQIEEPRQGIQFGVDADADGGFHANVRDPADGSFTGTTVRVPFRRGSPGLIDMTTLRARLVATGEVGAALDSAEYALQMLQLPYQQWFGEVADQVTIRDFLTTVVAVGEMRNWVRTQP
jgi:hypothetical protein